MYLLHEGDPLLLSRLLSGKDPRLARFTHVVTDAVTVIVHAGRWNQSRWPPSRQLGILHNYQHQ
ncbi:MAG TPA: hypothetical protein VIV60_10025 [Polyangiaceae bacterium]